jgi:hypothetical protein
MEISFSSESAWGDFLVFFFAFCAAAIMPLRVLFIGFEPHYDPKFAFKKS